MCYTFIISFHTHLNFCHSFFFYNYTATTLIYTLSLHDALPIFFEGSSHEWRLLIPDVIHTEGDRGVVQPRSDRKSTRLNSSHQIISYAVFCLKKKITTITIKYRSKHTKLSSS